MSDLESRISQLETQLQEADATATAMGLALTEARIENERLREELGIIARDEASGHNGWSDYELLKKIARQALNHSGDASKMVDGTSPFPALTKDKCLALADMEDGDSTLAIAPELIEGGKEGA